MSKFKIQKIDWIFICLLVAYGVLNAFIITPPGYFNTGTKFDWPDETAAAFLTAQVANHNRLSMAEPLNTVVPNLVYPRSLKIENNKLVPASFYGLPLIYGLIAKITGLKIVLYFTLIFFCLALLALYDILKRIHSPTLAFCSTLLIMFHPGIWYYALHSYLPNILFLSLTIISIWFMVIRRKNLLAGIFLGLAFLVRPAEFYWLIIIILSALYTGRSYLSKRAVISFFVPIILSVAILLIMNQSIYGSYFNTGYGSATDLNNNGWLSIFFPFGLHLSWTWENIVNYIYNLSPLYFILTWLGVIFALWNYRVLSKEKIFKIILPISIAFTYLLIFYGSWVFTDTIIYRVGYIGVSYVRYWLPFYFVSAILGGYFLTVIYYSVKKFKAIVILFLAIFGSIIVFISSDSVLVRYEDSFLKVKSRRVTYQAINALARRILPNDAIIISSRSDKLFFPEFKVIIMDKKPEFLPEELKKYPLYYYNGNVFEKL